MPPHLTRVPPLCPRPSTIGRHQPRTGGTSPALTTPTIGHRRPLDPLVMRSFPGSQLGRHRRRRGGAVSGLKMATSGLYPTLKSPECSLGMSSQAETDGDGSGAILGARFADQLRTPANASCQPCGSTAQFERNWWMFFPGRKAAIAWPTSTVGVAIAWQAAENTARWWPGRRM